MDRKILIKIQIYASYIKKTAVKMRKILKKDFKEQNEKP